MRKELLRGMTVIALALLILGISSEGLAEDYSPPKPGPEFDVLKKMEGTWQANVKYCFAPDQDPVESTGTMTFKMECGGLWLCSSFSGDFGGYKFQGKGMDSYDASKKKYVSVWVDSMASTPETMEGTYDKATRSLTMTGEFPGQDGKLTKRKSVSVQKDDDTIEATMSSPGKDGKDVVVMKIVYKRKK
jgi:hypothetical protein